MTRPSSSGPSPANGCMRESNLRSTHRCNLIQSWDQQVTGVALGIACFRRCSLPPWNSLAQSSDVPDCTGLLCGFASGRIATLNCSAQIELNDLPSFQNHGETGSLLRSAPETMRQSV